MREMRGFFQLGSTWTITSEIEMRRNMRVVGARL
jgi:hypothetical protein